jgi:hypothetical protein
MALGIGFQLAGYFTLLSLQFLFQTPDFGRLIDVLVEPRPACVLVGNNSQFLHAKVNPETIACQFKLFLLYLVANRQIPMFAVK